jgi:hypothetical protein
MRKHACYPLLLCLAALCLATAASAAPISITFGRDIKKLQQLVDRRYGKNRIDVTKDFVGAHPGDIDPWFWVGDRTGGLVAVNVLARNPNHDVVGWYLEGGGQATLPDGGGVLFHGPLRPSEVAMVSMPAPRVFFGFYIDATNARDDDDDNGDETTIGGIGTQRFYTDRKLNECGPDGRGALHPPYDGDVQALIFDVSRWAGGNTWLVCFEDKDTGGLLLDRGDRGSNGRHDDDADGSGSDNDFNDVVFEVRANGATLVHNISFGALKVIYR